MAGVISVRRTCLLPSLTREVTTDVPCLPFECSDRVAPALNRTVGHSFLSRKVQRQVGPVHRTCPGCFQSGRAFLVLDRTFPRLVCACLSSIVDKAPATGASQLPLP